MVAAPLPQFAQSPTPQAAPRSPYFYGASFSPYKHPRRQNVEPLMSFEDFMTWAEAVRPSMLVFMDDTEFAKQAHIRLSGFGTKIFYRYATVDSSLYKRYPRRGQFCEEIVYRDFGGIPISVFLANEGECHEPAYIRWQAEEMDYNSSRMQHPLAAGGLPVGTPTNRDYGHLDGVLKRISDRPDIYSFVVNEYILGKLGSDLTTDKWWDHFDRMPENLLIDDNGNRRYLSHVGRIADMDDYRRRMSYNEIPTYLAEFQFDGMEDKKEWVETLPIDRAMKARGGRLGARTLEPYFRSIRPDLWEGDPSQGLGKYLFETCKAALSKVYSHMSFMKGAALYRVNDSGDGVGENWEAHRIDVIPGFMPRLAEDAKRLRGEQDSTPAQPPIAIVPPPVPSPQPPAQPIPTPTPPVSPIGDNPAPAKLPVLLHMRDIVQFKLSLAQREAAMYQAELNALDNAIERLSA